MALESFVCDKCFEQFLPQVATTHLIEQRIWNVLEPLIKLDQLSKASVLRGVWLILHRPRAIHLILMR